MEVQLFARMRERLDRIELESHRVLANEESTRGDRAEARAKLDVLPELLAEIAEEEKQGK